MHQSTEAHECAKLAWQRFTSSCIMQMIKTPGQFIAFMEAIWNDECKPGPDGGMIIHSHPQYNEYHDAVKIARQLGMRISGNTVDEYIFRFPDQTGVAIRRDGSSIRHTNRYGAKRR